MVPPKRCKSVSVIVPGIPVIANASSPRSKSLTMAAVTTRAPSGSWRYRAMSRRQPEGVALEWPQRTMSCERTCSRWQDVGPQESIGTASAPCWSTPVACTDALVSADAHTSTHAGGIASRRNRSRTAGSSTEPPASSTHLSGRTALFGGARAAGRPGGLAASDCGSRSFPRSLPVGCHPPQASQPSEGGNDPTPARTRDKLAIGISNIVNAEMADPVPAPTEHESRLRVKAMRQQALYRPYVPLSCGVLAPGRQNRQSERQCSEIAQCSDVAHQTLLDIPQ